MKSSYQERKSAQAFHRYSQSADGEIEHALIWRELKEYFPRQSSRVLDAACGSGWLSGKLSQQGWIVDACDISPDLITHARRYYPQIAFRVADLTQSIPYQENTFDSVVMNMAAHDVVDMKRSFRSINRILKENGLFIMTIANPYYSYPIGVWKRGWMRWILRRAPLLRLRSYASFARQKERKHTWGEGISSYFRTLPEYINTAVQSGLKLQDFREIQSEEKSNQFDRQYQLFYYPMLLLLVFQKES